MAGRNSRAQELIPIGAFGFRKMERVGECPGQTNVPIRGSAS